MLSPAMFRKVELPALKSIMGRIGEVVGHPIPCIIGGDTTPIVEPMLETGTGYLVNPFETDQTAFMAALDPYRHITSSHICMPNRDPTFFREPRLQFVNNNAYPGVGGLAGDQIQAIRDYAVQYHDFGKPVLVAECAGHWAGDPAFKMERDTLGSIWAGLASNLAGVPLSWWWNFNYGEDLGHLYRVAADFMKDEDLIAAEAEGGDWANRPVTPLSRDGNARALMVGNRTRRFLFLHKFDTLRRTRLLPSTCADTRVLIEGLTPGPYRALFWDLRLGRSATTLDLEAAADGTALLAAPDFTEGWAVKIVPRQAGAASARPPGLPPRAVTHVPRSESPASRAWSWRIEPLAVPVHPMAAERSLAELRIALPQPCHGLYPRCLDESGQPIPFAWGFLGGETGWRLRIPASSLKGPLRVVASEQAPAPVALDETAFGLSVTVASGATPWLAQAEDFDREFARLRERKSTRVAWINQLENPLGENENFLALYSSPLLIPHDGNYEFASNSDDASFVRIDGRNVVARPGQHDMDVLNQPDVNLWRARKRVSLERGLHWVEYAHQQRRGGCLARLGWLPAPAAGGPTATPLRPFDGRPSREWEVVPAWALDGRVPCRLAVECEGRALARIAPSFGLELRRPAKRIPVVAFDGGGQPRFHLAGQEGPLSLPVEAGGQAVPVWAWNAHWRRFSLEWESGLNQRRQPALKLSAYDIDLPVQVAFGSAPGDEQTLARGKWTMCTPLPGSDGAFVVRLRQIPLLSGRLDRMEGIP